jgi:hypothetical protein
VDPVRPVLLAALVLAAGCERFRANACYAGPLVLGDVVELALIERLDRPDLFDLASCSGLDSLAPGTYRFAVESLGTQAGSAACYVHGVRPLDSIGDVVPSARTLHAVHGPVSTAIPYCDGYWKLMTFVDSDQVGFTVPFDVPYVPGEPPPLTVRRSIEGYECHGGPPIYCADTWAAEIRLVSRGTGDVPSPDGG